MIDRFMIATPLRRVPCRLTAVANRALHVPPLFEVGSELCGHFVSLVAIALFLLFANALMQLHSSCRCHSLVPCLLIERMDEAIASRDDSSGPAVHTLCLEKLIAPRKPLTTFFDLFYRGVQAGCDCGCREFYHR